MYSFIFRYDRVKELRKKKGLSVRSVADIIDYNYSALSLVENGKRNPSCDFIGKLAGALGVTPNYFFEKVKVEENNAK